jgi:ribosome-associated protein
MEDTKLKPKSKDGMKLDRKPPRPVEREAPAEVIDMAIAAARAADARLGEDIVVLDLHGRSQVTDYFVIVTGKVDQQLAAIGREIADRLAALGCRTLSGRMAVAGGGWALMDYGAVVVHAFTPEVRNYYDLDLLWGDAPRVEWREPPSGKAADAAPQA